MAGSNRNNSSNLLKQAAADAALAFVAPKLTTKSIVGIGTGSTANCFIDALAAVKHTFDACVASSQASTERLQGHGITVLDLNAAADVAVYIDGADEVDADLNLIKGGGAALTREKIVAASADEFVCIVDASKVVATLGQFPLPVEVIPMARGLVARGLVEIGGQPEWRQDTVTDNGNLILDVHGLSIQNPLELEMRINNLVGVVCNGIFAANRPNVVFVAEPAGIQRMDASTTVYPGS